MLPLLKTLPNFENNGIKPNYVNLSDNSFNLHKSKIYIKFKTYIILIFT